MRFGEYGISVLAARDEAALDAIARSTLVRESVLTLTTIGAIRATRLELRPTFRRPHYTLLLPDLDADIERATACEHVVRSNPHYHHPEDR